MKHADRYKIKNVGMQYNRDWDTNSTKDRYEQQDKEKLYIALAHFCNMMVVI